MEFQQALAKDVQNLEDLHHVQCQYMYLDNAMLWWVDKIRMGNIL